MFIRSSANLPCLPFFSSYVFQSVVALFLSKDMAIYTAHSENGNADGTNVSNGFICSAVALYIMCIGVTCVL